MTAMPDDLRETMVQAAAARYGSEHYRAILFWRSVRRFWLGLLLLGAAAVCAFIGYRVHPKAHPVVPALAGSIPYVLGGLAVVAVTWLLVRRARSPYRRRRF